MLGSEAAVPLNDDVNAVAEKPVGRSSRRKNNGGKAPKKIQKNNGGKVPKKIQENIQEKVPKKIHKAEREKLKRDNLNVLFLKLSKALEPAHPNNGKASILSNATRLLRDLLAHVDSLKEENTTLLSESRYVSTEKNELIEENSTLQAQIDELNSAVQGRTPSESVWKLDHLQSQHDNTSQLEEVPLAMPVIDHSAHQAPVLGPLFVVPLHHRHHHHDLQAYHISDTSDSASKLPTNVRRPHARYPSSSDSWPSQVLAKQSETTDQIPQHSSSVTSSSYDCRD